MTTQLTVAVREDARPPVLAVGGEIDMANAGEFRAALAGLTARHDRVEVDLTAVRYLDSAAINVIYDHLRRVSRVLVAEDSVIFRALAIAGLSEVVTRSSS
ncbi:MAG TPA: STAS domain-containing protein [Pseudonocardia sp.]|nr:STAS domain-containing protein [Pseudonocardia sp.]